MTGFEDTLTEILIDEAERHQAPTFDAYAIADRAGAPGAVRRNRFALAAGIVAVTTITAGAVYGLAGGSAGRTNQTDNAVGPHVTLAYVRSGGHYSDSPESERLLKETLTKRAAAAGIKDWSLTVRDDVQTISVTGPVADRALLETMVEPGVVTFRPVLDPAAFGLVAPAAADCARPQLYWDQAALTSKGLEFICNVDHSKALLVAHSDAVVSEVAGAQAIQEVTSTGTLTDEWVVGMTLSAAGTRHFAEITTVAYNDGGAIAVVVDGVSYVEPTVTQGPITGSQAQITGSLTERRAKLLAAVVGGGTLPSDFKLTGETESK
jgi:hypothetical protein